MVDGKSLRLADLDFNLVATNAGGGKKKLNPERQLVRYQFMEVFVRLALDKFIKCKSDVIINLIAGATKSPLEAVTLMADNHVLPFMK